MINISLFFFFFFPPLSLSSPFFYLLMLLLIWLLLQKNSSSLQREEGYKPWLLQQHHRVKIQQNPFFFSFFSFFSFLFFSFLFFSFLFFSLSLSFLFFLGIREGNGKEKKKLEVIFKQRIYRTLKNQIN